LGPAVSSSCAAPKSNPIPWGAGRGKPSPSHQQGYATDQRTYAVGLACARETGTHPCSARYSPPVGSQLPVVELPICTAPPGHAGLNQRDKNSSKEKQSTNTSPAAGKCCSNRLLPFFVLLTCTSLHLRCLRHPKSKISPAFLNKFGVKHIKTFPHMYRTNFLKKPQILPPGSLMGYFFLILLLASL